MPKLNSINEWVGKSVNVLDLPLQITSGLGTALRYGNKAISALSPFAKKANKGFSPLRLIGLARIPYDIKNINEGFSHIVQAPRKYKVFPSLNVTEGIGNIIDSTVTASFILSDYGVHFPTALSISLTIAGTFAIGLQSAGVVAGAWSLFETFKLERELKSCVKEGNDILSRLTQKQTGIKYWKEIFFGAVNQKQKDKIEKVSAANKNEAVKSIFKRIEWKKGLQALGIALAIISAVGTLLLLFGPSPAAPVAWGILAGAGIAYLISLALNSYSNKQLNMKLDSLAVAAG